MKRANSTVNFSTPTNTKLLPMKATIIATNLVRAQGFCGDYIEYKIKIFCHYKTWFINKRFSDFENLNKILSKSIIHLPPMPPKRLFKNSEETIAERKTMFNRYLKYLFHKVNIFQHEAILDFIKIDKKILQLVIKKQNMISEEKGEKSLKSSFNKINMYVKSKGSLEQKQPKSLEVQSTSNLFNKVMINDEQEQEDKGVKENYYSFFLEYKAKEKDETGKPLTTLLIEEFLRNLAQKVENKSEIIRAFEIYMKKGKKFPNFSKLEIIELFIGETDFSTENTDENGKEYLRGLFYHIGDIESNLYGAQSCLMFLDKLLNYEFNPMCEIYRHVFKTRKIENFLEMRIEEHALSNNTHISNCAFNVIKIIFDEKFNKALIKKIVKNEVVYSKFLQWITIKDM